MPETPLTEILQDFRSYRPGNHREFLEWVKSRAQYVRIKEYAMEDNESASKQEPTNQPLRVLMLRESTVPQSAKPSPRLPLASLVFHTRIHLEEDRTSYCYWRQSNCSGKLPSECVSGRNDTG